MSANITISVSFETIAAAQACTDGRLLPATTGQITEAVIQAAKALPVAFNMRYSNPIETFQAIRNDDIELALASSQVTADRVGTRRKRQYHEMSNEEFDQDDSLGPQSEASRFTVTEDCSEDEPLVQFCATRTKQRQPQKSVDLQVSKKSKASLEPVITVTIIVVTLTGRKYTISAKPSWTVLKLKEQHCALVGVPPKEQRLTHRGRQLEDDRTLQDYCINDGDLIRQILNLKGS